MSAVRAETAFSNVLAVSLIPLSSVAMYKGITGGGHISEKWLSTAGLLGAGMYTYGTTFISKPRQRVYMAGAEALGCLILSSRPLLYSRADMESFKTDLLALNLAVSEVQFAVDLSISRVAARRAEPIDIKTTQSCRTVPVTARKLSSDPSWDELRTAYSEPVATRKCKSRVVETQDGEALRASLDDIERSLKGYKDEILKAALLRANGDRLIARIDNAGNLLREKAVAVQNQVNTEVMKTEPDIGAVLQSLGNLRALSSQIVGVVPPVAASSGSPTDGAVAEFQSDKSKVPRKITRAVRAREEELAGLPTVINGMARLRAVQGRVQSRLSQAQALSALMSKLDACKFVAPANQLNLVPDVDEAVLLEGGSLSFIVSGGTGAPMAQVAGMGANKVKVKVDVSGAIHQIVLEMLPGTTLLAGEKLYLQINDGSGNLKRVVEVSGTGEAVQDRPGGTDSSTIKSATQKQLCELFGRSPPCLKMASVVACYKKTAIDPNAPIDEDKALQLIKDKQNHRCD
jgi:hypothetical protein